MTCVLAVLCVCCVVCVCVCDYWECVCAVSSDGASSPSAQEETPAFSLHPWSRQRVYHGILSGALAKRDLVFHMRRVAATPLYARRIPPQFWSDNSLSGPLARVCQSVDAAFLLKAYDRFLIAAFGLTDPSQVHQLQNAIATFQVRSSLLRVCARLRFNACMHACYGEHLFLFGCVPVTCLLVHACVYSCL